MIRWNCTKFGNYNPNTCRFVYFNYIEFSAIIHLLMQNVWGYFFVDTRYVYYQFHFDIRK